MDEISVTTTEQAPSTATPPPAPENAPKGRISDWTPPPAKGAPSPTNAVLKGFGVPQGQEPKASPEQPKVEEPKTKGPLTEEDNPFLDEEATTPAEEEVLKLYSEWKAAPNLDMKEFGSKLVELKTKDGIEYKTVSELRDGNMRLSDYSRSMQQVQQKEQQVAAAAQEWQGFFEEVKSDPNKFVDSFERNFGSDYMMEVALVLARREQQDLRIIHGSAWAAKTELMEQGYQETDPRVQQAMKEAAESAKQRLIADRQGTLARNKIEHDRQKLEKQQQEAETNKQVEELSKRYSNQIAQLAPKRLQALGLNWDHPKVRTGYLEAIKEVMRLSNSNDITPQLATDAATLLAEQMSEYRAKFKPQQTASGYGAPASPSRQAGAGGASQRASQPQRQRLSDWKPPFTP